MGSKQSTVDFIVDQMADAGTVSARKMFGEHALYLDGKMVGLVCDNQLFIKPTQSGRSILRDVREAPPYPGAKPYFLITEDRWDEETLLSNLVRATAQELPAPIKKGKK